MIILMFALSMVTAMSIASIVLVLEDSADRRTVRANPFNRNEGPHH
jgi:hypothetical protein